MVEAQQQASTTIDPTFVQTNRSIDLLTNHKLFNTVRPLSGLPFRTSIGSNMVSKHSTTTTIIAVLSAILVLINPSVEGHGYMLTPRCRQVYAAEFGVGSWHSDSNTLPLPEYCPHCQLVGGQTYGVCGTREEGGRDYTFDWVTGNGTPMPFISQGTYAPGGTILVESVFTANHEGHIVVGICPNVANPTQECFDANQLEFVEDPLYGAPKDVNYPERGYIAPTSGE